MVLKAHRVGLDIKFIHSQVLHFTVSGDVTNKTVEVLAIGGGGAGGEGGGGAGVKI